MRILTMLWKNFWGGSPTMLIPCAAQRSRALSRAGAVRSRALYRLRHLQVPLHVARHHLRRGKGEFTWGYDPGQCTFCGRCVEGCTEHALKEHASTRSPGIRLPADLRQQGELKKTYTVARKTPAAKPAAVPRKRAPATDSCSLGGAQ